MKIRAIEFNDDERPSSVIVVMSEVEALFVAKAVGSMTGNAQDAVMLNGDLVGSDIYDCLTGLFNGFYEDGIDEAMRTRRPAVRGTQEAEDGE